MRTVTGPRVHAGSSDDQRPNADSHGRVGSGVVPENVDNATLCYAILSETDMDKFAFAIRNNYWYQMYIGTSRHLCVATVVCVND